MSSGFLEKVKVTTGIVFLLDNWAEYLGDYLGSQKNGKTIYRLRNGIKYSVRKGTSDKGVINDIWIRNTYIPKGFEIRETDIIIDIGAHIGVFAIFAAKKAGKGKVFAIEPFPENYSLLTENVKLNDADNVITLNAAVCGKPGKKSLFLSEESVCHSFYKFQNQSERKLVVDGITLHGIMEKNGLERVDLLKIDCEGAEYDILLNDKKALDKIDRITMEYHNIDGNSPEQLKAFLEEKGFDVEMGVGHPMIYAKRKK